MKRRMWFLNKTSGLTPGSSLVPARFSSGKRDMFRACATPVTAKFGPVTDLDARLAMHGARNLNPVITLNRLPGCPQAGGRCSVTGLLWPFRGDRDGETWPGKPAYCGRPENMHRQPYRDGRADCVVSECRHGLAIASESLLKTASAE